MIWVLLQLRHLCLRDFYRLLFRVILSHRVSFHVSPRDNTSKPEEQHEVTTSKLAGELPDEGDEDLSVDRSGMDREVDESSILTDRRDERQSLDLQVGIDNLYSVPSVSPTLRAKCVEREYCLIKINNSSVQLLHLF